MNLSITDALAVAVGRLEKAGVDESRLKAEVLLAHVLGCRRLELPLHGGWVLTGGEVVQLESALRRLTAGEPLQYVLGEADFMGRTFKADRRALIPRPETENLVETVLADSGLWFRRSPVVADVGTGGGCIVISLALAHPGADYLAIDADAGALELARDNARAHGVEARIEFLESDLLSGAKAGSLDAVVSNPPYVAAGELGTLAREVRDFEPRMALDGGPDGLAVISRLVPQAFLALRSTGRLFLETGENHAGRVAGLMMNAGFTDVRVRKDLAGHDRVVCGLKT